MALHRYFTHLRQLLTLRCLARATHTTRKQSPIEPLREIEKAIPINNSKNVLTENTLEAGRDIYIGDQITYVNQHGEELKKIPRLLTGLPFVPEGFQGRDAELQYIYEHLFGDNHHLLLLVNGEGGVGKTSLASRYFYTHQDQYAHLAWVFSEKNLGSALLQMAIPLGLQFDERADTLARLQVLLQSLFELQKPCLLIIDNANDLAELRQYLPLLQRCSNFHLLFTTRVSDLPQVAFYKIAPLPQDLALQVFKSHYPAFERAEEALFYDLYEAVQGNTLVLELLAKNLRNFNNKLKKHYLLADLRRDLEQGLLKMSKTSTLDVRYQAKGQGLRSEKMELIILAMYDMGDLIDAESQLLSVFAVLPAESIPFTRLETLLPEQEELDATLLALAQKGWLEYNEEAAAFKCSPVVQEVVRLKQKDLLENCGQLIAGLKKQLARDIIHLDNYTHSALFASYAEALLNTIPFADYNLGWLFENVGHFHRETGDLNRSLGLFQKAEHTLRTLLALEPENNTYKDSLTTMICWIGMSYQDLGDLMTAIAHYEQYNSIAQELYASYPLNVSFKNGLAISYSKLGQTHSALGNLNQALTFFEKDIELSKELYASYPQNMSFKNGLAISYSKLGDTHSALGNLNQALTFFEKDIELSKELYASYPQNVSFKNGLAISYEKLGQTHSDLGNLNQALTFFEQYNQLEQELYAAYPQNVQFKLNLGWSYQFLGITNNSLGNLELALKFFEDMVAVFEELYASYPQNVSFKNGLAISYSKLGDTHSDLGNLDQALTFFELDLNLTNELYKAFPANVSFKNNLTYTYKTLGLFYRDQKNDPIQSRIYLQQCHDLWQELTAAFPAYAEFSKNHNWAKEALETL